MRRVICHGLSIWLRSMICIAFPLERERPRRAPGGDKMRDPRNEMEVNKRLAWGPFLERPGNLPGPESDFDIKVSRKVGRVLSSDEVHFVSLADNFTVQFSNLLKLPQSRMENKTA